MSRTLGLSVLIGLCVACGGNADNGLFDPVADGGNPGSSGSGGGSNASGGTSTNGGTSGNGGPGSGGMSTAGTGSGSGGVANGGAASGGTGHAGTGGSAAGGKGNQDCEQLIDSAYEALAKARACDPNTDIPHCTGFVEDPCGCTVAIEQPQSEQARGYAAALEAMRKTGCSIACLAIVCFEPIGGVCHENGSC